MVLMVLRYGKDEVAAAAKRVRANGRAKAVRIEELRSLLELHHSLQTKEITTRNERFPIGIFPVGVYTCW